MIWTKKNILILVGLVMLAYISIFLLAPRDTTDYTIADTEYSHETDNKLLLKSAYEYNNKEDIQLFPSILGDWKGMDFKYQDWVYKNIGADILLSRVYTRNEDLIYLDIINSRVGESFHKQTLCVQDAGWTVDNESISEFDIANFPNTFTKLYTNRLDLSKEGEKQVMVYWFMFKKFGSNNTDSVTMIRISAPGNDTDSSFNLIKNFLENQLFGTMYKDIKKDNISNAEYISTNGIGGVLGMIIVLLIPIGLIIIGVRKKE